MTSKRYIRSPQVAARRLGDEIIIMSAPNSTLFTLNEIAALIWEAADGSRALHEIVESEICPAYDVPPDLALQDAESLAEELAALGILLPCEEPVLAALESK
jgi:coenzyme PQQ synthesis protein D (PqqD)